jgi:hypothetical protein
MSRSIALPLLDRVGVASPCHARWEEMTGDERVRHCSACDQRVHNISGMTRDEAEALLRASAGEGMCIRLYRRSDGTILTADCPVGLMRARVAARRALVRVAALTGLVGLAGVAAAGTARGTWGDRVRLRAFKPFSVVCEWIAPSAAPAPLVQTGTFFMGKRSMPVNPPSPPGAAPASGGMGPPPGHRGI